MVTVVKNVPMTPEQRKVIFASSLGTVFEWYDFYLYGSLAPIIARQFFTGLDSGSGFIFALLALIQAVKLEPFAPADAVPHMPILLVAGSLDERARSMSRLAELSPGAKQLVIPGRTHNNTVTSREFKEAAINFLN